MQHVVTAPFKTLNIAGTNIKVDLVPAWMDNLIWVVWSPDSPDVWVVDGPEADAVLAWCEARGKRLKGILNTHTHPDHVGINRDLAKRGFLDGIEVVGPKKAAADVPGLTRPVCGGDQFELLGAPVDVLLTEGHIDGHLSFVLGDVVFCGDTLFAGGCGYLFDGPPTTMFQSLLTLASLPPATRVCCAHEYTEDNLRFAWHVEPGNPALAERIRQVWATRATGGCTVPSTIEDERATNPFLRPGSPTIQARLQDLNQTDGPLGDDEAFATLRAYKNSGPQKTMEDGDLPLEMTEA